MEIISELPSILFTISIAVTVFAYGLYARSAHLLHPFRAPRIYVLALLAMFIVTPMIALMCAVAFDALALDALALDVPRSPGSPSLRWPSPPFPRRLRRGNAQREATWPSASG